MSVCELLQTTDWDQILSFTMNNTAHIAFAHYTACTLCNPNNFMYEEIAAAFVTESGLMSASLTAAARASYVHNDVN